MKCEAFNDVTLTVLYSWLEDQLDPGRSVFSSWTGQNEFDVAVVSHAAEWSWTNPAPGSRTVCGTELKEPAARGEERKPAELWLRASLYWTLSTTNSSLKECIPPHPTLLFLKIITSVNVSCDLTNLTDLTLSNIVLTDRLQIVVKLKQSSCVSWITEKSSTHLCVISCLLAAVAPWIRWILLFTHICPVFMRHRQQWEQKLQKDQSLKLQNTTHIPVFFIDGCICLR